jgi:hypothetical protein
MHSEYFGIANHKLTLGVRCGQEKRPGLAAEKKSLGEIAKELSAMWGVDAKEIDHWPSSQTSQTGSNHCWMDGWTPGPVSTHSDAADAVSISGTWVMRQML